jgi:hypothetical protein
VSHDVLLSAQLQSRMKIQQAGTQYVAYGRYKRKLTLWMVQDIAPAFAVVGHRQATQHKTRRPASSSYLNVPRSTACIALLTGLAQADATQPFGEDGVYEDLYANFFQVLSYIGR